MKRLARHLFTLCPAASLVLCVAVCVLWVRSYWVRDRWGEFHGTIQRTLVSDAGRIEYAHIHWRRPPSPDLPDTDWSLGTSAPGAIQPIARQNGYRGRFGVGWDVRSGMVGFAPPNSLTSREWWVPHWMAVVVLVMPAVPLAWKLALVRRQRLRRQVGLCPQCGYDLRASPGRCPECGAAAAAAADGPRAGG